MRVDIFSDVVCPWCYLGERRFSDAVEQLGVDGIEVHWRAFQLDPAASATPGPLKPRIERKYGPGAFDAMTERLVALGQPEGIEYRFDRAVAVNTLDAHRLIAWSAHDTSTAAESATAALVEQLFQAYFTDGADVSDHAVLVDLAERAGLSREGAAEVLASDRFTQAVRDDQAAATDLGVTGVPAFVIDGQWMIPGAQDTDRLVQLLGTAHARAGADS